MPLIMVTVYWEKGSNQTFQGLLDTGSELALIPRDLGKHYVPLVKVGIYEGQVINVILVKV